MCRRSSSLLLAVMAIVLELVLIAGGPSLVGSSGWEVTPNKVEVGILSPLPSLASMASKAPGDARPVPWSARSTGVTQRLSLAAHQSPLRRPPLHLSPARMDSIGIARHCTIPFARPTTTPLPLCQASESSPVFFGDEEGYRVHAAADTSTSTTRPETSSIACFLLPQHPTFTRRRPRRQLCRRQMLNSGNHVGSKDHKTCFVGNI